MEDGIEREKLVANSVPWIFSESYLQTPNIIYHHIQAAKNRKYPISFLPLKQQVFAISQNDLSKDVKLIKSPVLIINGDEDKLVPISCVKKLADAIPSSQMVLLEGVGHMPHIEAAEKVIESIKSFFNK